MDENENGPVLMIEKILPREFIYQLGAYLQTCAHIELLVAAIIACLNGKTPDDNGWFEDYCAQRKRPTKELIKTLQHSANAAECYGFSKELLILCNWLNKFKNNRHAAAHGAFFGHNAGFLRMDFVNNVGGRKKPEFRQQTDAVTKAIVIEALEDADRIYHILLGMIGKIDPELPMEIHRRIIPIVTHPY